jgi:hypothetical protein
MRSIAILSPESWFTTNRYIMKGNKVINNTADSKWYISEIKK